MTLLLNLVFTNPARTMILAERMDGTFKLIEDDAEPELFALAIDGQFGPIKDFTPQPVANPEFWLSREEVVLRMLDRGWLSAEEAIAAATGKLPEALAAAIDPRAAIFFAAFTRAERHGPLAAILSAAGYADDTGLDDFWATPQPPLKE